MDVHVSCKLHPQELSYKAPKEQMSNEISTNYFRSWNSHKVLISCRTLSLKFDYDFQECSEISANENFRMVKLYCTKVTTEGMKE